MAGERIAECVKPWRSRPATTAKEQFVNSPDLKDALMHAVMDALDAHATMSTQALGSERVRAGLKDLLLGPAQLYESLRAKSEAATVARHR